MIMASCIWRSNLLLCACYWGCLHLHVLFGCFHPSQLLRSSDLGPLVMLPKQGEKEAFWQGPIHNYMSMLEVTSWLDWRSKINLQQPTTCYNNTCQFSLPSHDPAPFAYFASPHWPLGGGLLPFVTQSETMEVSIHVYNPLTISVVRSFLDNRG